MESCEQRGLRSVVWLFLARTAFNPSSVLPLLLMPLMSPAPALRIRAAPTRPACPWPASTPMSLHRCPGHDDIVPCSVPHPAQTARAASCPPCLNIHYNGHSRTALVSQSRACIVHAPPCFVCTTSACMSALRPRRAAWIVSGSAARYMQQCSPLRQSVARTARYSLLKRSSTACACQRARTPRTQRTNKK